MNVIPASELENHIGEEIGVSEWIEITQERININDMVCMTPGISSSNSKIDDQKYRTSDEVDTDYIIVGRAIYNSKEDEIEKTVQNIM